MAKRTPKVAAPARATAAAPTAVAAATAPFAIALSAPGEDVPDGGRRIGCPNCGAKHDIVPTEPRPGQAGTWSVPDFECLAPCGYSTPSLPVG